MYHQQKTVRATINNNDVGKYVREQSPATKVCDTHPHDWGTTKNDWGTAKNDCDTMDNNQTHTMNSERLGDQPLFSQAISEIHQPADVAPGKRIPTSEVAWRYPWRLLHHLILIEVTFSGYL